jgi:hypothetical protein
VPVLHFSGFRVYQDLSHISSRKGLLSAEVLRSSCGLVMNGRLAAHNRSGAPPSIEPVFFDASVLKMEFILAGSTLAFNELREMQSAGRGGVALPGAQAA